MSASDGSGSGPAPPILPGLLLAAAALCALLAENSPLSPLYGRLLDLVVELRAGDAGLRKPLLLWINDGLMALFFLIVGIEVKREVLVGKLSSLALAALPALAAAGGIIVPALVYLAVAGGDATAARGWAIPCGTDIAFSIGLLGLIARRAPPALRVFLLALAIIDDLAAIVIIAAFYTASLSTAALVLALIGVSALAVMNLAGVRALAPYVIAGLFTWTSVLQSGVHATLAGVAIGFALPLRPDPTGHSPATATEHGLLPWVNYAILPVFAFANAGVSLAGFGADMLVRPVSLAILLGLFLGKQTGVFLAAWLAIRLGIARMPEGASWRQIYGVAILTGIGFTMSLFIGTLAFAEPARLAEVRIGVLAGSLLSALLGAAILRRA